MKHTGLGTNAKNYVIYIEKGEKINKTIEEFCISHKIVHASYTGIGAIHSIDVAQYDPEKKNYNHKIYSETCELISMVGNFGFVKNDNDQDKWFAHTHIAFSNAEAEAFGGHLFEAEVRAVVEVYLVGYKKPLFRAFNADIGLNTMNVSCGHGPEGEHDCGCHDTIETKEEHCHGHHGHSGECCKGH